MNAFRSSMTYGQRCSRPISVTHHCFNRILAIATASAQFSSSTKDKYVLFVRHGMTEMNEHLERMPWYSENFFDVALWDTRLSARGIKQAIDAHGNLKVDRDTQHALHKMEVLLSSPLTRALHTAELVFKHQRNLLPSHIPHIAHPLLRERLYLSSEVGRLRKDLQKEFPHWDLRAVPEDKPWWYVHPNSRMTTAFYVDQGIKPPSIRADEGDIEPYSCTEGARPIISNVVNSNSSNGTPVSSSLSISEDAVSSQFSDVNSVHDKPTQCETTRADLYDYVEWRPQGTYCCEGEPSHVFAQRIHQLKQYLNDRPEQYMVVVAHWGIIRALTGQEFNNCEMRLVRTSDFLDEPLVSDE